MTAYYADKLTTLYHGDCLEVMAALEPASFDAVICDPPYGTTACAWDSPIPFAPMWAAIKRLITPRAPVVLFGSQPFTSALVMSWPQGFKYSWVWEKDRATGHLRPDEAPLKGHEDIVVFSYTTHYYYPQKTIGHAPSNRSAKVRQAGHVYKPYIMGQGGGNTDRYPRSIQKFNTVNSAHGQVHPTQKPLDLLEYLVRTYTNDGGRVLDFTCGSGTTLRACKNLGRVCVGIERERHYCDVTVKRLAPAFEDALPASGAVDWSGTLFEAVTP